MPHGQTDELTLVSRYLYCPALARGKVSLEDLTRPLEDGASV